MSDFKEIPVGQYLKLTSGFPFTSSHFSHEGVPLIRIRDLLNSNPETFFKGYYPPGYMITKGDLLIGMDGDFNVVRWRGSDALLNQRVLKVEVPNESVVIFDYVFHWLGPYINQVNTVTPATTVKHLSTKDLFRAKARFPSTKAQRRIAAILDKVDITIEKTQTLIDKYQQIKSGLMQDLFTRGVMPNGQLRPPREEAPELYQNTAIGWIPKEWTVTRMIKLAENRKGSTTIGPFGSDLVATDYRTEGVPVTFVRDIKEFGFQWKSEVYVSAAKAKQLIAHRVMSGEILATKMGLPPCVSCVYPEWMPAGVITADIIRLSPNLKEIDAIWLATAINYDRVRRQVAAITAGVTRPKVTLGDFRSIKIAKPRLDEQKLVCSVIDAMHQKLRVELVHVEKLQQKKLGLMQDLLTGKVQVNVDAPLVEAVHG